MMNVASPQTAPSPPHFAPPARALSSRRQYYNQPSSSSQAPRTPSASPRHSAQEFVQQPPTQAQTYQHYPPSQPQHQHQQHLSQSYSQQQQQPSSSQRTSQTLQRNPTTSSSNS